MALQPRPTQPVGVARRDPISALIDALLAAAREAEKQASESNYADYVFILPWTYPTKKRIERMLDKFRLVAEGLREAGVPSEVIGRYAESMLEFKPTSTSYFIKVYTVLTPEMEKALYAALELSGFLLQHRTTRPTGRKVISDLYMILSKYDASVGGLSIPPNMTANILKGDAASVAVLKPFAGVIFGSR